MTKINVRTNLKRMLEKGPKHWSQGTLFNQYNEKMCLIGHATEARNQFKKKALGCTSEMETVDTLTEVQGELYALFSISHEAKLLADIICELFPDRTMGIDEHDKTEILASEVVFWFNDHYDTTWEDIVQVTEEFLRRSKAS